jgi:hypothetical protein
MDILGILNILNLFLAVQSNFTKSLLQRWMG